MDVKKYQDLILRTAIYPRSIGLAYCALGLSDEAGEVTGKIKKFYRDTPIREGKDLPVLEDAPELKTMIKKELGDVLWYLTALANELGLSLEEIMEANYEKLMKRMEQDTIRGSGDDREEKG